MPTEDPTPWRNIDLSSIADGDILVWHASTNEFRRSAGTVIINGLPTSDPHVVGQLYLATGAVKVSAG